jgi:hypothetical protein
MPMQQVEFEFPDPDSKVKAAAEIEVPGEESELDLKIEGAVGRENIVKPGKKKTDDEFEIEVVDDTPPKDRGKKPSTPPEDVTDEELDSYSDKVKKRIQHFSKGFHDERRAKEQALREREALETYTKALLSENQQLKGSVDKGHNALIESAKAQVQNELANARQKYKTAYESGDTDAIITAQEALNSAQMRVDKVNNLKPRAATAADTTLQRPANNVQQPQSAPSANQQPVARDVKAESWREDNSWFGSDDEMTAYALGYHSKLVKEGVDPRSDDYYERVNARMRKMFPENFDDNVENEPDAKPRKATNVVAPATRSTAPRKVSLSESQVAIARKLGVPLVEYAKQVANLQRKS